MIDFCDKHVTVLGLGRFGGGIAVSRWLVEQEAQVLVADESSAEQLADSVNQLSDLPIKFRFGTDVRVQDFTDADLVVVSPAIPPHNPFLQAARAAGVSVTTEICLFVQRCKAQVIGVTGTKGKSTTSTLLNLMLGTKHTTWFGGNIGRSLLAELPRIEPAHLVVLELSSFMLEHLGAIGWSPHVAVVTMISADHLDWHGSSEKYIDAKRNIVLFQNPKDFAVLNQANPPARSLADETAAAIIPFDGMTDPRFTLKLAGEHNQLNAQAAFAAAALFGIDWTMAQTAIADFTGLTHRLQVVHESNGVQFINDSISTIPEAAIAALGSFATGRVIQIVGGSGKKHLPIDALCDALTNRAKAVLCIGETADLIASKLPPAIAQNANDLPTAVRIAKAIAISGDIVLLSPGHPSYDQFTNFESRGSAFVELVKGNSA